MKCVDETIEKMCKKINEMLEKPCPIFSVEDIVQLAEVAVKMIEANKENYESDILKIERNTGGERLSESPVVIDMGETGKALKAAVENLKR